MNRSKDGRQGGSGPRRGDLYDENFFNDHRIGRNGITSVREFRFIRYAARVWLLQERGGLSFAEARIYTHDERPETFSEIDEKFGFEPGESERSYPEICAQVEEKLKTTDIFCGFTPVYADSVVKPGRLEREARKKKKRQGK
ncbi:MAG: hypothetical protein LKJ94_00530 [Candidatus Methanomethylophilus sp.]|jgi:hypothetical protein|nr:hypothetical protein [Methanomethylophilus sp.]MCI2074186.1 hypothetical protein [Methanomethylophilus sp.]MCI2093017.1 hypothetical protein [Methanomethylophilus sp.]WII09379.1 hypothetical protein O8W32_00775 [Methanomassiliicoccales archaeon LGM-DZ1]